MLDCNRCSSASSSTMLIILICERIITTLQIKPYGGPKSPTDNRLNHESLEGAHHEGAAPFKRRLFLGEYQIDTEQEWTRLVDLLTSLQLRRLRGLLVRLRSAVELAGWEPQLAILQSYDARLRDISMSF
jgi:hypothetical protein